MPRYGDYQSQVERRLPVVMLEGAFTEAGPDEVANLADKLVEIHTWLRDQLRHVRAAADAHFTARDAHTGPGDPPAAGLNLQIRQHCLAFCESLHFHHSGEDAVMLPGLEQQHPHLRDTIEQLRDQHGTVAKIQRELEEALADVATADPDRFRTELDRMSQELEAHLDYEEAFLLPVLAAIPFPPGPPGAAPPSAGEAP
jgi:iron-sulfur cluster repair protein YtfE (RIC family)